MDPVTELSPLLDGGRAAGGKARAGDAEGGRRGVTAREVAEDVGLGPSQALVFVVVGIAIMADAVEIGLLSFIEGEAGDEWDLSNATQESISAVVFIGEIFGAIAFGPMADRFGRLPCAMAGAACVVLFGFLSAFSPNVVWLMVFRFMVGFGIGGLTVPYDLLVEMLPGWWRGKIMQAVFVWWTIGSLYVDALAWGTLDKLGWRALTLFCCIPPAIAFCCLFALDESPRWLVRQGRTSEARAALDRVYVRNGFEDGFPSDRELVDEGESHGLDPTELFVNNRWKPTICGWVAMFAQCFGYYGVVLYLTEVFPGKGGSDYGYTSLFISCIGEFIGEIVTYMLVDSFGRNATGGLMFSLAAVTTVLLAADLPHWLLVIDALVARGSICGASNIAWLVGPEMYDTRIRATGHSWCNVWARIGALVATYWSTANLNEWLIVAVFFVIDAAGALALVFLPPPYLRSPHQGSGCAPSAVLGVQPDVFPELEQSAREVDARMRACCPPPSDLSKEGLVDEGTDRELEGLDPLGAPQAPAFAPAHED